jgi:hypothetical protein
MPQLVQPPAGAQVLNTPNIVVIFWSDTDAPSQGTFWTDYPDYLDAGLMFFMEFLHGFNIDRLEQYGVGIASICRTYSLSVSYSDLGQMIVDAINNDESFEAAPGWLPNMVYVYVIDPTSTHAYFGGSQHDTISWNGITAPYTFAPFGFAPTPFVPASDGWTWWRQNGGVYTTYISHELYECFTDPFPNNGWTDTETEPGHTSECCDVCEDILCGADFCPFNYGPWSLESYWSNQDQACVMGFALNWFSIGAPEEGIEGLVTVAQNVGPVSGQFDGTGAWVLFAADERGDLCTYTGNTANSAGGVWNNGGWSTLVGGASLGGTPVAASNATLGLLEVFGISFANSEDGELWHVYQTDPAAGGTPFGVWMGGESLGAPARCAIMGNVAIGQNAPNPENDNFQALEAFIIGSDGQLHHNWQIGPWKGWSGWEDSLGAPPVGIAPPSIAVDTGTYPGPTVASNVDGRLEVFVLGQDNAIWHISQLTPNSGWGDWASLSFATAIWFGTVSPQPYRGSIQTGVCPNGSIELFVTGTDGNIYHCWQEDPYNPATDTWSAWAPLSPLYVQSPYVLPKFGGFPAATNASNILGAGPIPIPQAFTIAADGGLWTTNGLVNGQWQPGVYQSWRFLGAPPIQLNIQSQSMPFSSLLPELQTPVIASANIGLTVFVIDSDGNIWGINQSAPLGPWGSLVTK